VGLPSYMSAVIERLGGTVAERRLPQRNAMKRLPGVGCDGPYPVMTEWLRCSD
jgi:hypothetical protein